MTPDRYEDVMFEMNHELAQDEQSEIDRRVAHAQAARRQAWAGVPEQTSETTEDD